MKKNTFYMSLFKKKKLFFYQSAVNNEIWYRTDFSGHCNETIKPLYFRYNGLGQYETKFYITIFIYEDSND